MEYKSKKHFLLVTGLIVAVIIVLAGSAAAATSYFAPGAYSKIAESIVGKREEVKVKVNQLQQQYLAKGASSDTVLVKFKSDTSDESKQNVHKNAGTKVKKKIDKINVDVVNIPSGAKVGETIDKISKFAEVEYVEPNFLASAQLEPNDSLYQGQWNLQKVAAPLAWDDSQGGAGPIAVVDTGVMNNHPDLNGQILTGYNFVNDSAVAEDDNGHGTHVSGIISASTNNGLGVASIGFKSNILPVKVLDANGSGSYADVASGIIYSADHGAKVINLSLGGPTQSAALQSAVSYATNKGSFVVAAAGNSGSSTPLYPAACEGALAVTATDSSDNLASFSSYGKNVFVGAPGVNITSTYLNSSYRALSGTSMATPHFSGLLEIAIAYIGSSNKSVTNSELLNYVKAATDKVGPYSYDQNGWNPYFGYGRLNAQKLFGEIKQGPTASPTAIASVIPSKTSIYSPVPSLERSKVSFSVELHGDIDSIDSDARTIKIKVKNISQHIKLNEGQFIDLYLADTTEIRYRSGSLKFEDLAVGDEINAKSIWENDQLKGKDISIQKRQSNGQTTESVSGPTTTPTATNPIDSGNSSNPGSSNSNKNKKK